MDAAQLEARRHGIGGSEAAAACGVSKWQTPLHVYLSKLGLWETEQNEAMQWGLWMEDLLQRAYEARTGTRLCRPAITYHSEKHKFMFATPDRLDEGHTKLIELKTARTREGWGEPGSDEIPHDYVCQVQHQMAVLDAPLAEVAVLFGGCDFQIYSVPRSDSFITTMVAIEAELWQRIQDRNPPPPDWQHPDTPALIQHLYRPRESLTIQMPYGSKALVDRYEELGRFTSEYAKERERLKARLTEMLGEAGCGVLEDGRQLIRKIVRVKPEEKAREGYDRTDFRVRKLKEVYHGE